MERDLESVVEGYLEAAFWADLNDSEGEPVPGKSFSDIDAESMTRVTALVTAFLAAAESLLDATDMPADVVGHNLWLNAAGHGTGFWDRGLGDIGDALSELCRGFVLCTYLADDGTVYFT